MAWSCPASPAITNVNYMNNFSDQFVPGSTTVKEKSCLPNNGNGFSSTQVNATTGIVDANALSTQVTSIQSMWNARPLSLEDLSSKNPENLKQIIVSPDLNPAKRFSSNASNLRSSIQREYCFYYNRYAWGLQDILGKAAAGETGAEYTRQKVNVATLNSKLNQILQILQGLTTSRVSSVDSYYANGSGVNTLNSELDVLRGQLAEHSTRLRDKALEQNVQSAMIDYSLEKNASSRNLLGIYGFMNIVAIGLLFYLYRSSKA